MSDKMQNLTPEECREIRKAKKIAQWKSLNNADKLAQYANYKSFQGLVKVLLEEKAKKVMSVKKVNKKSPEYLLAEAILNGQSNIHQQPLGVLVNKLKKAVCEADFLIAVELPEKELKKAVSDYFDTIASLNKKK